MPKLAIYIPKKDMREIEKWRKKLNFSQIFMQALHHEIAERSRQVSSSDKELSAAASHYREALAGDSGSLVDCGFRSGERHVVTCHLKPSMIGRLLAIDSTKPLTTEDMTTVDEAIGSDADEVYREFEKIGFDERMHPLWKADAYRGYVQGVAAAWNRVCEVMKSS